MVRRNIPTDAVLRFWTHRGRRSRNKGTLREFAAATLHGAAAAAEEPRVGRSLGCKKGTKKKKERDRQRHKKHRPRAQEERLRKPEALHRIDPQVLHICFPAYTQPINVSIICFRLTHQPKTCFNKLPPACKSANNLITVAVVCLTNSFQGLSQ